MIVLKRIQCLDYERKLIKKEQKCMQIYDSFHAVKKRLCIRFVL